MNLLSILGMALRSLRRAPLRSALTALGVIAGVAAVIGSLGIGNGAKSQVENLLAKLDRNVVTLSAFAPLHEWRNGLPPKLPLKDRLTQADYDALRHRVANIAIASPEVFVASNQAEANGRRTEPTIRGLDIDGFEILSRRLNRGSIFGRADILRATNICLITQSLADNLFPGRNPIGRWVHINGVPFSITGIVADDEGQANPQKPEVGDAEIFVPYTSLLRRLDRNSEMFILFKATAPQDLDQLQLAISDTIEQRRGSRTVEFKTHNSMDTVRFYTEGSRTMALLLAAIAAISLVVGGVGIMNIMTVTVTERTREVGILLAIGMHQSDILKQYLVEATTLSVAGGTAGILLGIVATHTITNLNAWPSRITMNSILGAFVCSVAVGVIFGYYPASRAARMNPIDALRSG